MYHVAYQTDDHRVITSQRQARVNTEVATIMGQINKR